MLKGLLRRIKKIAYSIPFGMKAGDEMLATSNKDGSNGIVMEDKIEQNSLLNSLLRGEVTQEVEELRYETYKAEEESNNYKYIGNGVAMKIDSSEEKKAKRRLKFTQYNRDVEYGMKESMSIAESKNESEKLDYVSRKLFRFTYIDTCVRFKHETYIEKIDFDLRNGFVTKMHYICDKMNRKSVPFANAVRKIKSDLDSIDSDNSKIVEEYVSRNEILSSIKELEFTTFNATNNVPNGIRYVFRKPKFENIECSDDDISITFSWKEMEGGKLLSEIYYSDSAEKKFKNKEKKKNYVPHIMPQL